MQHRRLSHLVAVLALVASFVGVQAAASAAPNDRASETAHERHERITGYWDAEAIAGAVPRDVDRMPPANPVPQPGKPDKPDKPGNGNGGGGGGAGGGGGGGGGDTVVGGASWTGTFATGSVGSTTGKIFFTMGGIDYVCSGSTVASPSTRTLVLTAGHCVYDDVANAFATHLVFMPDFDHSTTGNVGDCATTPYGCWVADSLVATQQWAASDFDHDYAFAVFGDGGSDGNASLADTVGTQGIAFNQGRSFHMASFGYPAASPYGGTDLVWCAGTVVDDPYGATTQGLTCDMTGGSSGGPWFASFDEASGKGMLNSVNSYKYTRGKKTITQNMYGPYFGAGAQQTYQVARSAGTNTLVNAG